MKMFATKSNDIIQDCVLAFVCLIYNRIARLKNGDFLVIWFIDLSPTWYLVQLLLTMPKQRYISGEMLYIVLRPILFYNIVLYTWAIRLATFSYFVSMQ